MMDSFITKDGKKMRRGYTTGSCAAAAAKAAAIMLLGGKPLETVWLMTPLGIGLTLTVKEPVVTQDSVSCGIVKDSGDDPDVTNGMTVYASVEKIPGRGTIEIDGGEGIGRVTRPGLDQPVGNAAINSTPRRMITQELLQVCEDHGYDGGLRVVISAPEGAEIAKKTFNPRLGIVGGLSILGTTGIVEPMSDDAVVETIRTELSQRRAEGKTSVLFVPGNYGADFLKKEIGIGPENAVTISNFVGDAFSAASEAGFTSALLIGHIGKLIKLAKVPVMTYRITGGYQADPRWAHTLRKGPIRAGVVKVYMPEELARLTPEEITEKIEADLFLDPEANTLPYRGKRLAEGLEEALFLCPKCGKLGTLRGQGSDFTCTCGLRAGYTETGLFTGEAPFASIPAWDDWQAGRVKALAEAPDLLVEDGDAELRELGEGHAVTVLAKGRLRLDREGLTVAETRIPPTHMQSPSLCHFGHGETMMVTAQGKTYELLFPRPKGVQPPSIRKYQLFLEALLEERETA